MTDLETSIRDALHSRSDELVLRRPELGDRTRARNTRLLVAAAVLVVLAIAGALAATRGSTDHGATPAAGSAAFVGYRWRLVSFDDAYGHAVVPQNLHAYLGFGRDGSFVADDTVNFFSGHYRVTGGGYSPVDVGGTLVGFGGNPHGLHARVIGAIDSAFIDGRWQPNPPEPYVVAPVRVRGDTMTIGRLIFQRVGSQSDASTAAPSATSSSS